MISKALNKLINGLTVSYQCYIALVLLLYATLCLGFVAYNFIADDFGLWRSAQSKKIIDDPHSSKFLLAQKYIPENFENIIIGPSVSANMNPADIHSYKFYNLSSPGANMQIMEPTLRSYFKNTPYQGVMLVCLYPYILNDNKLFESHAYKTPKASSLFSTTPLRLLFHKIKDRYLEKDDVYDESEQGFIKIENVKKDKRPPFEKWLAKLQDKIDTFDNKDVIKDQSKIINPQSYDILAKTLQLARDKGYKVVGYYYPLNKWDYQYRDMTGEWKIFQDAVQPLFQKDELVLDFNSPAYAYIHSNKENYLDSHLNMRGSELLAQALDKKLETYKDTTDN